MAKNPARRRRSGWLPEGSRVCPCAPPKANFFLRENLFFQAFERRNGKRNRRANLCGLLAEAGLTLVGGSLKKAMKIFLLPCACGSQIPVGPGQAGGRVRCDRCGTTCDVPRLGDLARHAVPESPAATTARRWTIVHACLVGGCATALIAAITARFLATPTSPPVDVAGVREAVSKASAGEVYRVWTQIARSGVARPPLAHERRLEQMARVAGTMSRWLMGLAVLGGVVAFGAAVTLMLRRPSAGSQP